jgi:hypothetical protein
MKCTITIFDKIHIINRKCEIQEHNLLIKFLKIILQHHLNLIFHSILICNFLGLVNFLSKCQVSHKEKSFTCRVNIKTIFQQLNIIA